jgi:glycosyltransferase involved in cell wall biosynthesis
MPAVESASPASGERPLRIAYLGHVARLSGAEIALLRLLHAAGSRLDATVILAEDGELVDPLRETGAKVEVLPLAERARGLKRGELRAGLRQAGAGVELARYVGRLRRRLRELEPDLVHTTSLKASVYGTIAARAAGLPVLWHLHDRLAADYLPRAVVPGMRLLAATAPTALVANSRLTLETVGARFRRGMTVAVVPNAIPYPERPVELRDEVETVAMMGRLTEWKGQHVFLEAFAAAFPDGPVCARLIGSALFGEEDYELRLREQAERLRIADRVDFAGFTSDVAGELERIDLLVHASIIPEPLGQVVLEGMAAGVPVVAADAGGPAELVRDGREGLLHRPGDAGDLAGAMRRAADPDLRRRIASGGRERAREYAPEAVAQRWLALYRELAARRAHS